jgi:hypothetical protein
MTNTQTLRVELINEINSLPDEKLPKALDLLKSLLEPNVAQFNPPKAENNPLLDYIGGISHGSLSADVDKELYGEQP